MPPSTYGLAPGGRAWLDKSHRAGSADDRECSVTQCQWGERGVLSNSHQTLFLLMRPRYLSWKPPKPRVSAIDTNTHQLSNTHSPRPIHVTLRYHGNHGCEPPYPVTGDSILLSHHSPSRSAGLRLMSALHFAVTLIHCQIGCHGNGIRPDGDISHHICLTTWEQDRDTRH